MQGGGGKLSLVLEDRREASCCDSDDYILEIFLDWIKVIPGLSEGSVVKSACCSGGGLEFDSERGGWVTAIRTYNSSSWDSDPF